jgi:hypothetical protein
MDKTTNQFTKEMIEAFGIDQLAIRLSTLDGELIKKTDNWIDESEFIRVEKQHKARESAQNNQKGTYGYKRY